MGTSDWNRGVKKKRFEFSTFFKKRENRVEKADRNQGPNPEIVAIQVAVGLFWIDTSQALGSCWSNVN